MHDLDPVFRRWTRSPKVAALMAALGFARPLPVQVRRGGGCLLGLLGRWALLASGLAQAAPLVCLPASLA